MGAVKMSDIPSLTRLVLTPVGPSRHSNSSHSNWVCVYLSKASLQLLVGAEHMHLPTPHADGWLFPSPLCSLAPGNRMV